MASQQLQRTTYRDPNSVGNPVRAGDTTRAESAVDMDKYYRPLEQIHGSSLHGWGVAAGLRVTATLNSPGVRVLPGVALDVDGRQISLAQGGSAEIGQNADASAATPDLAGVAATGVVIPTAGLSGEKYVTIQFWEWFDSDAYLNLNIFRYNHFPWIRLLNVAGFIDDGTRIVLAKVTLGAGANVGQVTGLSDELRRGTDLPVESIHLRQGQIAAPAPNLAVDNAGAGEIRARPAGGIEIKVPNATDEIHLARDGGNFAKVALGAEQIVARRSDGKESIVIDTPSGNITAGTSGVAGDILVRDGNNRQTIALDGSLANITVGTAGNEGDILVRDANNRLVITLDGNDALIVAGAEGNAGEVRVKNNSGQDSINLNGVPGDISFRGRLRDPNGAHGGIGHDLLRHLPALTNGNFTTLHRHSNSGNATRAIVRSMLAINGVTIITVQLGSSRRVFAYIAITSMDPLHNFDRGDGFFAEVFRVDGNDVRFNGYSFDGDHLGPDGDDANLRRPFFVGQAQSITFRLRSAQDAAVWAAAVVFPEE